MNKSKSRLNIIDLIVIILLLAAITSNLYMFIKKDGMFTKVKYDITYTVVVENINSEWVGNITAGDVVCDHNSAFNIGKVSKVIIKDSDRGISDLEITINAVGEKHNGILEVNGVQIVRGNMIHIRVPNLVCVGKCTSVKTS